MDPGLTPEQHLIREAARAFLERAAAPPVVRALAADGGGFPAPLWRGMTDLGWHGILVPESHGGTGGGIVDVCVVMRELGRAALASPFLASSVIGAASLVIAGSADQRDRSLGRLARGDLVLTLAVAEAGARHEGERIATTATERAGGVVVDGAMLLVPYADAADRIVVVARRSGGPGDRNGLVLMLIDRAAPGVATRRLDTIGRDGACEVVLSDVTVPAEDVLAGPGDVRDQLERILEFGRIALCAEMVGAMERVLELTVEHARGRVQFGRPIGTFQALQHQCADAAVALEVARSLTLDAARLLDGGQPADAAISMAKAWTSEAYRDATWLAARICGGAGFLDDHDLLPLFYRRAKASELSLGDPDHHRDAVARDLLVTIPT